MNIILYGPPGSGKTTVGRALSILLERTFIDADVLIEARAGRTIPEIFAERGEAEFRRIESDVCTELGARDNLVIAPGGGALLTEANRRALEKNGVVFCLRAPAETLLYRLSAAGNRPLLAGQNPQEKLNALLAARRTLYDSFPEQISTANLQPAQVAEAIIQRLKPHAILLRAPGLQHDIALGYGLLAQLPEILRERGLTGSTLLVTDENIAKEISIPNHQFPITILPAGEQHKNLATVEKLYGEFLKHGLDRGSVVIALGGGVLGDMVGFAAATFMRGVRWVNVPTTLLSMVDASLGGKTGVDLPQGKNLVGAFHPPVLVISDPLVLNTLPTAERVAGMAEVIKHALIDDAEQFAELETASAFGSAAQLARNLSVKVRVVEEDPFEKGRRATLNLGHTIGHGVEAASGYQLRHGEAIAIGLHAELLITNHLNWTPPEFTERVLAVLRRFGLPTHCPGLEAAHIRQLMSTDKKKSGGQLKFALPRGVGDVAWGVAVPEDLIMDALQVVTERRSGLP
ncbi:MAG: 3-dehydroquinate synthase [Anaerolineales bacterium]|nr:3-dehydroquinate synthase [Anaerolineales bacterium]